MTYPIKYGNTDQDTWFMNNCELCRRFSCYSRRMVVKSFLSGKMSLMNAEYIGYVRDGTGLKLNDPCRSFLVKPKAKDLKVIEDDNLKLF